MHLLWCCEKNYKLKQLLNYASKLQCAAIIHGATASLRWLSSTLPFLSLLPTQHLPPICTNSDLSFCHAATQPSYCTSACLSNQRWCKKRIEQNKNRIEMVLAVTTSQSMLWLVRAV